jgi:hypothetical protein
MDNQFWDSKFSIDDYFYGTLPNQFLVEAEKFLKKKSKVLCLAEGEGRNAVFLALHGHQVTCVDFSSVGKEKAMKLASKNGVSLDYQLSNLLDFDFKVLHWDAIVSVFCHLPPDSRKTIHSKITPALRENGLFIIEAYTPEQLQYQSGGPKDISMLYTTEILKADFPELKWNPLEEDERHLQEGIGHQGQSVTLRGIGIKV